MTGGICRRRFILVMGSLFGIGTTRVGNAFGNVVIVGKTG
jgi:hypothetical protein